ncbi:hypothetical protein NGI45_13250 [Escherichia coli]|nr:hypothetical protein [Escherichia coli]MEB8006007.1 hypothetical protein [Escherichia coli]MGD65287.1 hypothetical protein [Escherichia coli]
MRQIYYLWYMYFFLGFVMRVLQVGNWKRNFFAPRCRFLRVIWPRRLYPLRKYLKVLVADGGGEWWRVKTLVTTLKPAPRLAYKEKWWRVVASFYKGRVGVLGFIVLYPLTFVFQ